MDDFYAVIPAGGAGTRLWPLSRSDQPKFLLDLTGAGKSLLQSTVARLTPLTEGIVIVTGQNHLAATGAQLPELAASCFITEPSPRNTMAAIGLAAAVLQQRHGDVIVGSFAADHVIHGETAFAQVVAEAVAAARAGYVTTIGIAATDPSTGFGYIESGASLGIPEAPTALHAVGFTEKPDADTAAQYVNRGNFLWNAGMFVSRTEVLLDHLTQLHPELAAGLREIAHAWDTENRTQVMDKVWPGLEKIAIDHAIAEPVAATGGVAVVPGSFAWRDIGDFATLASILPPVDNSGNQTLPLPGGGDVIQVETGGTLVIPGSGRVITLLGVDDVVVVDTADALLITSKSRAQQVGKVVEAARNFGYEEAL
jgi:mannose-1-phosphate guanylyltransferase